MTIGQDSRFLVWVKFGCPKHVYGLFLKLAISSLRWRYLFQHQMKSKQINRWSGNLHNYLSLVLLTTKFHIFMMITCHLSKHPSFGRKMGHCAGFLNLVDIGMVSTMKTMFSRPIYGCVSKSCIPLEMAIFWKTKQVCLKVGCTTNYVYQWVGQMLMNHDDPVDFGIFLRFPMAHRLSDKPRVKISGNDQNTCGFGARRLQALHDVWLAKGTTRPCGCGRSGEW